LWLLVWLIKSKVRQPESIVDRERERERRRERTHIRSSKRASSKP